MHVTQAIGKTPLVQIGDQLYATLESVNPSGSIKDRMAAYILNAAEARGELKPGGTIVEATSGNTGIALAMLAAERGYKMIVVLPSDMSRERKQMIRAFGAEIVEVKAGDFAGAVAKRNSLIEKLHAFNPNQFANPDNRRCHYETTGQELLQHAFKLGKPVNAFVAGVGTGGTLMGVAEVLREHFPEILTVAVEPTESAVMSGGKVGKHTIQGIGDGFVPPLLKIDEVNEVITVSSDEAATRCQRLASERGLLVGLSSGANVFAAEKFITRHHPKGIILTILPDRQERYFSLLQE